MKGEISRDKTERAKKAKTWFHSKWKRSYQA